MNVTEKQLSVILKAGEGLSIEFKECKNSLNRDVYETVCSFLNRQGGTLLLGVNDAGKVVGVNQEYISQIKNDFVTAINNPQKINPACYLSVDEVSFKEKLLLHIFVPESSQVHRCNGRIFDRNEDGDLDITDHTRLVSDLYLRKQACYSENRIFPYATFADLRGDLIAKIRKMVSLRYKNHPWADMDDLALMKSAQLYQSDFQTKKSGFTLAGILLFGKDETILTVVPHHKTDLVLRRINLDRYDDRDDVRTNLIESYDRIMAFISKHLPDPFFLERDIRISIRDAIFREVTSNILIHREFMNPYPAKLIIEHDRVRTENSNKPHGFGVINPSTFSPFPKNPVIARFFKQIDRADELGSGVRNLMKYGKAYGGFDPELIEGDIFRIVIGVPHSGAPVEALVEAPVEAPVELFESEQTMLIALKAGELGRNALLIKLGNIQRSGNFKKVLKKLLDAKYIEYTIPDKPNSRLQKYKLTEKGRKISKIKKM